MIEQMALCVSQHRHQIMKTVYCAQINRPNPHLLFSSAKAFFCSLPRWPFTSVPITIKPGPNILQLEQGVGTGAGGPGPPLCNLSESCVFAGLKGSLLFQSLHSSRRLSIPPSVLPSKDTAESHHVFMPFASHVTVASRDNVRSQITMMI